MKETKISVEYTVKIYKKTKEINQSIKNSWGDNYEVLKTVHSGCFKLINTYKFKNKHELMNEFRRLYPKYKTKWFNTNINSALKNNGNFNSEYITIVYSNINYDSETISFKLIPNKKKNNYKRKNKIYYCDCIKCIRGMSGKPRQTRLPDGYYS